MNTNEVPGNSVTGGPGVATFDMKLEVVVIPVSDVDRAKEFYSRLGWRLDADRAVVTTSAWSRSRLPVPAVPSSPLRGQSSAAVDGSLL